MTLEVTAFTGLGPGVHNVVVTDVTIKQAKGTGGNYLRWEFSDREGHTTSANGPVEMTPGNKTGKWFASLTGRPTVVGEKRELSEVIGKAATIVLELNAEGFPKVIALTAGEPLAQSPVRPLQEATKQAETQHALQEDPTELPF